MGGGGGKTLDSLTSLGMSSVIIHKSKFSLNGCDGYVFNLGMKNIKVGQVYEA